MEFLKAERYDPSKHTGLFLLEAKLDGMRLKLKKGQAFFKGGIMNVFHTLPEHIQAQAIDEWVDGELNVPGGTASDVRQALNRDKLVFTAFYLPGHLMEPIDHLRYLTDKGFTTPDVLEVGGCDYVTNPVLDMLELHARANSLEGFILKQKLAYPFWYKYKVEETADLLVTGIKGGTGKYAGHCGALLCSDGNGKEIAAVSGMDDDTRFAITTADIGRIVEVKYQEIASQGRLRHPRFVRWRDDKQKADVLTI